ncbi:androgen-dependent TFPI-regulating protein-like [Cydia fagiglandana]|uniref:androgen-dependent TFPI-regulating protein-like n=1 Tax=Cydia fagiglandana TaxID=1458189 RepID=UPI002FEE4978
MSKLGYLRLLGYVTTLTMHIGNLVYVGMNLTEDVLEDKRVRIFGETRRRYFTCWTFFLHMIYAIVGLTCEILLIMNSNIKNYSLPKHLKGCRDTMFAALLWPASLLVFTVFWSLFLYDRSLIFPDFIDKVLTPTSNHIMHTAIVPTVLWEILLQPRFEPRSHVKNVAHLVVYMLVYLGVFIYTYIERGIWLYPIFKKLYGTIYFPVTMLIIFVLLLIFYRIQWRISYLIYGKEKTKKEKAKKIR